ncbi:MAG: hypothetical protein IPJ98_11620 [Bryobacterales bacterium]|nr:hypothetical protein [Bryobacterales bacterium]
MKRRSLLKTVAAAPLAAQLRAQGKQAWLGPDYWANPLQDWRRVGDRIECHVSGGDRNVYWLTRETAPGAPFTMSVRLGKLASDAGKSEGYAGFRFGMRGHFNDYRDTALRGLGIDAGITTRGKLFIGTLGNSPVINSLDDVTLTLTVEGTEATLEAGGVKIKATVPEAWTGGGVALVAHHGAPPKALPVMREPAAPNAGKQPQERGGDTRFWFSDWKLAGAGVRELPVRAWGPILFLQYTLSRRTLKLTAQLAPVEVDQKQPPVELRVNGKTIAKAQVEPYSSTALFRIAKWDDTRDTKFTLHWRGATYDGVVKRDPKEKQKLVVGALTCQGEFGFPHQLMAANLHRIKPDILFFTGDQLYEANGGYGIQRGPAEAARLDYLRKWFMYGWAWGSLTREIPTVSHPDDHDVYHGNIWGAGGRKAVLSDPPPGSPGSPHQMGQDSGGYLMPPEWVTIVERTQSSHLPDDPDSKPIEQGIPVHFGQLVWGGVSFAIIEDRKWKSAPKDFLAEARIWNGWAQNPMWNAPTMGDVKGAQLLGERQEQFLERWARDWDGVTMKAAVSGTIFCNLATLPREMMSDAGTPRIPVEPIGGYARNDKAVADHDSNGWPQTPRNRALRLLRTCQAVHIAGDQHLASTVQYGIDDWNDGSYSICTPAISNVFPRRWFPPDEGKNRKQGQTRNMGEFVDGFGNKVTVHAVANPARFGVAPAALNERAPGFGVVEFDKTARTITLINYARWTDLAQPDAKPYPGWPITIAESDNGLNGAKFELALPAKVEGVVEVFAEGQTAPVLSWRLPAATDRLRVWAAGTYTVKAGKRTFAKVKAEPRA